MRAYDLVKYVNFRVLTAPGKGVSQITCLAVTTGGSSEVGDIVCGGSNDPFEIYVWNLKTG